MPLLHSSFINEFVYSRALIVASLYIGNIRFDAFEDEAFLSTVFAVSALDDEEAAAVLFKPLGINKAGVFGEFH